MRTDRKHRTPRDHRLALHLPDTTVAARGTTPDRAEPGSMGRA